MRNIRITANNSDASSTINLQTCTGNELRLITGQKQTVVRYISGICQASEWDVEQEFLEVLFGGGDADEGFKSAIRKLLERRCGKGAYKPVPLKRGQTELTRICFSPYSDARPFVACLPSVSRSESFDLEGKGGNIHLQQQPC